MTACPHDSARQARNAQRNLEHALPTASLSPRLKMEEENVDTLSGVPDTAALDNGLKGKIWVPYLALATTYDNDLVTTWRDDMESILIFAALFSASVTAFVIESYKILQEDTGQATNKILLQISQQLANSTAPVALTSPPFQPDPSSVALNIFWFLSLAFSLTCSLGAVMVRQWARDYLRGPQVFSDTTEQARMRHYLFQNLKLWKLEVVVDFIPALLHVSLILFFIGLLIFLHTVNTHVALSMLSFCAVAATVYAAMTLIRFIFPGCPFRTPLSDPVIHTIRILGITITSMTSYSALTLWLLKHRTTRIPHLTAWRSDSRPWWTFHISAHIRLTFLLQNLFLWIKSLPAVAKDTAQKGFQTSFVHTVDHRRRARVCSSAVLLDGAALKWTVSFIRRPCDTLNIIAAIPGFIRTYGPGVLDPKARVLLLESGVTSRIFDLFYADRGDRYDPGFNSTPQSIQIACLAALHEILPAVHNRNVVNMKSSVIYELIFGCLIDKSTMDDEMLGLLATSVWTTILVSVAYWAENSHVSVTEISVVLLNIFKDRIEGYMGLLALLPEELARDNQVYRPLRAAAYEVEAASAAVDRAELKEKLLNIRRHLVSWTIRNVGLPAVRSISSFDAMALDNVYSILDFIPPFPHSSTQNQIDVIQFSFQLLDASPNKKTIGYPYFVWLGESFRRAIFGVKYADDNTVQWHPLTRRSVESEIYGGVSVIRESENFQTEDWRIKISFDDYSRILDKLARSLTSTPDGSGWDYRSAYGEAVADILKARVCKGEAMGTVAPSCIHPLVVNSSRDEVHTCASLPVVTSEHIAVVGLLRSPLYDPNPSFVDLLNRTAAALNYAHLLGVVDVDAIRELSFYDLAETGVHFLGH